MNGGFGHAALRLCGVAARMLGWRPHEFWAATPAELAAALAPADAARHALVNRAELQRLMERDDGRG